MARTPKLRSFREQLVERLSAVSSQSLLVAVATGVWILGVGAGMHNLLVYGGAPGPMVAAPTATAEASSQPWRLSVFLHPRCPCSLATVSELERLLPRVGPGFECCVYLYQPTGRPQFAETALARCARGIPGVTVVTDLDGEAAQSAGAITSGACTLRDHSGELAFAGGITDARGHEGASVGRLSIEALVGGRSPIATRTKVYGCPIVIVD